MLPIALILSALQQGANTQGRWLPQRRTHVRVDVFARAHPVHVQRRDLQEFWPGELITGSLLGRVMADFRPGDVRRGARDVGPAAAMW